MSIFKSSVDPGQIKIYTVFHSAIKLNLASEWDKTGGGGGDVVHLNIQHGNKC